MTAASATGERRDGSAQPFRVLSICGSLRASSSNAALLDAAAAVAPPSFIVRRLTGIGALPHFNPDDDLPEAAPPVAALREAFAWCEGMVFCTPEYAHGVPGSLKNALDWLVSGMEVYEKPAVLLNASPVSTHAQASLRETLSTMSVGECAGAWVAVPLSGRKLGATEIIADSELAASLRSSMAALEQAIAARRKG